MRQVAGMQFLDLPGSSLELAPLMLLHGSGRREDDLLDFATAIAPERSVLALRGGVPFDGGFAFFDRNPDRSLNYGDIVRATVALGGFLSWLRDEGRPRPILVGYSNGAIAAASLLASAPHLSRGAILLRPLSPFEKAIDTDLGGYPVLSLSAASDERRAPSDAPLLEGQLKEAGASVTAHVLPGGHGWDEDGRDITLSRSWLHAAGL
jgi:phospholipase/carboxylesterase